jgi:hypothetical protein
MAFIRWTTFIGAVLWFGVTKDIAKFAACLPLLIWVGLWILGWILERNEERETKRLTEELKAKEARDVEQRKRWAKGDYSWDKYDWKSWLRDRLREREATDDIRRQAAELTWYLDFRAKKEGSACGLTLDEIEGRMRQGVVDIFGVTYAGGKLTGDGQQPKLFKQWTAEERRILRESRRDIAATCGQIM